MYVHRPALRRFEHQPAKLLGTAKYLYRVPRLLTLHVLSNLQRAIFLGDHELLLRLFGCLVLGLEMVGAR